MSTRIIRKQGDTAPALELILEISTDAGWVPYDLTDAQSVSLWMRLPNGTEVMRPMNVIGAPADGHVQYQWVAGDVGTNGTIASEVRVVDSFGRPRTFPNDGTISIVIKDAIGVA